MAIELVPLCTVEVTLRSPLILPATPLGDRWIFEVESARAEGERFSASLKGVAAADWLLIGPGGVGTLDIRVLMETDDGAMVFAQYHGRVDLSGGLDAPTIFVAPRFETGDERYQWLNRIQAVGKGTLAGNQLSYEWYEVR